ncbi:MAG: HAD hydrolase-like protein [Eubacteriales bacterium]
MKDLAQYRHIIWDFNGTILDDVAPGIAAVNTLLSRRGLPAISSREAYHAVFRFPIEAYYRRIGLEGEPFEQLAVEWVRAYREREDGIPLRAGVAELLDAFAARGLGQSVISASEEQMLRRQLHALGILERFDAVLGRTDIYAVDKTDIALAWASRHRSSATLLIGDTDHDWYTAQAAGFDCLLVAGGHQSKEYLLTLGCEVADDLWDVAGRLGV